MWAGASGVQERPTGAGTKKNAARGDSDGVFHFIELPKGKDSLPRQSSAACRPLSERVASVKKPLGEKAEGRETRGMGRASVVFVLDIDHSRLGAMNEFSQGVVPAIGFDPGIDWRVEELGEVGGETDILG